MKILTNLSADLAPAETPWQEFRGVIGTAMNCPAKGFYRHLQLQGSGLVLSRGKDVVCIPTAELWKLAERIEPALVPPAPAAIPAPAATVKPPAKPAPNPGKAPAKPAPPK